jgi:NitT/TauT family transport system substrate-binding protein
LKAGGLTEKDVQIVNFASPIQAKDAYISKNVDATVVWSPDNFVCMDARPSRELITTAEMPNTIVDVFVAKKSTLEKKKDAFMKLAKAWLTANAEVQNQDKYEWAATEYKKAFQSEDKLNDLIDGLKSFRFTTYGDNLNFFGLNPEYTGITGSDIYNKMARVYKNGYGNNLKNVTPWNKASNTSIIEGLSGMDDEIHAGEGKFTFTAATEETKTAPAIMTKRMTVNFAVNSARLAPEEERSIRSFIGSTANEFAGMRIRIEGNTDITGSRELNIKLSKERAQAVADYLISEYRFDPNRFIIVGNGPDKPIASNDTEAGRAKNRRTDFEFLPAK